MVIGAGGADTMIKAMVARLAALGGSVRLNADVAEIVRKDGRAVGIRLADGELVEREARGHRRRDPDGARRAAASRRQRRRGLRRAVRRNSATARAR